MSSLAEKRRELSESEQHGLVVEWNAAAWVPQRWRPVHEIFEEQVRCRPWAPAVESGELQLTYRQLNERANRLAHHLRRLGASPEVRVGIFLERSVDLVVSLLGVLKTGAAYVPLEVTQPPERLAFLLADAGPSLLVTREDLLGKLAATAGEGPTVVRLDRDGPLFAGEPAGNLEVPVTPDHLAYVIYTSGSTGRPKGSEIPHRSIPGFALAVGYARFDAAQTLLQHSSISWDALTLELWPALLTGGRVVLAPERLLTARQLARLIRERGVTAVWLTSALLNTLVDEDVECLAGLEQLMTGGEVVSVPHVRKVLRRWPSLRLVNGYGPSECTVFSSCYPVPGPPPEGVRALPIGRPIGDRRVLLVDEDLRLVPLGSAGELCISGPAVARGYHRRPDLTAERFAPDPTGGEAGGRIYRTGDLARWRPDGVLEFLGRIDSQVKIRGVRIELGEIEAVLAEHSEVQQAAVVLREDLPGGRGVVGFVVVREGSTPSPPGLRQYAATRLPEAMVPSRVVFVARLPTLETGKVDRRSLAEWPLDEGEERRVSAPRTATEQRLVGLFASVLGRSRVGIEDSFFELGGHSLLATQLVSRVRESSGVELPLATLFETPTVAGLARWIESRLPGERGRQAPPIRPVPRDGDLPMSFGQERLWFFDLLSAGSSVYTVPMALSLEGRLSVPAFSASLSGLVARHEVLRSSLLQVAGRGAQRIAPPAPVDLPVVDLTALEESPREAAALRWMLAEATRQLDLGRGPLMWALLLRMEPERHLALLTFHHAVFDGWSVGVLVRDLGEFYAAAVAGSAPALPPLAVQYGDFAAWERSWLSGDVLAEELAWWRRELLGIPELLDLPLDRPRPPVQRLRGARWHVNLSAPLSQDLAALARSRGATLFMVLLAGYQTLMSRLSGQEDVVVGTAVANRTHRETEDLIGFFVNTLALRGDLRGDPGFAELLARTRRSALAAFAHQDVPFEKLVEDLRPQRSLSRSPIFQVMLALQNFPAGSVRVPGLVLEPAGSWREQSDQFDLGLALAELPEGIQGALEYDTDLFDAATVSRLMAAYERLLAGAAACPEARLSELPLLSALERHQLLADWSGAAAEPGTGRCLHELFVEHAARRPEAVAVVCGEESVSYGELYRRAGGLARRLRSLGVGPEVKVGLLSEPSVERVLGVLGVLMAGGAYVPLDPEHPPERLGWIVESSGMAALLIQESLRAKLPPAAAAVPTMPLAESWRTPAGFAEPASGVSPANVAYVIYTSGSTGRPNGVLVQHRGASELIAATRERFGVGPESRVAQHCSFTFDASVLEIFFALGSGATLVVARTEERLGKALAELLGGQGITTIATPPSLLEALSPDGLALKSIAIGGDRCPASLARRWQTRVALYNCYGPTETTIFSIYGLCREEESGEPPIGRPVAATEVYLLDRGFQPVPIGAAGELCVGGPGLARGYVGQTDKTAERFVPHLCSARPGERLYRTGDLARYRADGRLEFLGRIDSQVKVRGVRIELGEIEAVLASHGEVQKAVAVVREDLPGGRGVVCFVVAREGGRPTVQSLRQHAAARLPEAMVPARVVLLESLPTSAHGKVDRRGLVEWPLDAAAEDEITAPRTPIEELLAGFFANLLGREQVGIEDDFFDLGGHSLLATRLTAQLHSLGFEVPLRAVFEASTVARLAARLEAERGAPRLPALPTRKRRGAEAPLSLTQQRLWILDRLEPGSPAYNVPVAYRLAGTPSVPALAAALGEVVRRHRVLRSTFCERGGEALQRVEPCRRMRLPVIDLSDLPALAGREAARRLSADEALRPFDLERGPLLRANLLRLEGGELRLLLTLHHIVADAWSMGILVRELKLLHEAAVTGNPASLPELAVQYEDYACWQRQWLRDELLERQLAFWRQRLADAPPVLELLADRPRPRVASCHGRMHPVELPPELVEGVHHLCRRLAVTPFMTLLSAFLVLLGRYTGRRDVQVGTPVSTRGRVDLEGLIGFFVNTLVLRLDLRPEDSVERLLTRVREMCLDAFAHQDLPFERLVEALQPERSLSYPPLVQTMFVFESSVVEDLEVASLRLVREPVDIAVTKLDLTLYVADRKEGTSAALGYATDLFDVPTVERLGGHWRNLLAALVATPASPLGDLPLLAAAERQQVSQEWGAGEPIPSDGLPFHYLVRTWQTATPDAPAVAYEGRSLSYSELGTRTRRLAHRLRRLGIGPEARVAVVAERSPEMIVAMLGVLEAGGAYVPLDPSFPAERMRFILADAGAVAVLATESTAAQAAAVSSGLPMLRVELSEPGEPPPPDPPAAVLDRHLAYVIYTSGSSGRPKGVAIEHRALVQYVRAVLARIAVPAGSSFATVSTPAADLGNTSIFGALASGGCLHVIAEERASDPEALASYMESQRVDVLKIVPSHLRALLTGSRPARLLPQRCLLLGGEALSRPLVEQVRDLAADLTVLNHYGPTEATVGVLTHRIRAGREERAATVPVGRPLPGVEALVVDGDLQPVPPGVPGELLLAGDNLARGYLGHPERTAASFVPHPLPGRPGARVYRTGDRARHLPDGRIEFLGRLDEQIKIRGFRVEPGEVAVVLKRHPGVADAVVVPAGVGEGAFLIAYWVAAPERVPTPLSLRRFLAAELPAYMVPRAVHRLAALPLTANGKVDRRALPALEPAETGTDGEVREAPRTELEKNLAKLWGELLAVEVVGREDEFFALGGHSLSAVRLISRVRQTFGVQVSLRQLFETPTLTGFARQVQQVLDAAGPDPTSLAPPPVIPRIARRPVMLGESR